MTKSLWVGLFLAVSAWAQSSSPVRYIVEFQREPAIRLKAAEQRSARMAEISQDHAVTRQRISNLNDIRVVGETATVANAIIVETAKSNLAKLKSLPGVKHVQLDRDLKLYGSGYDPSIDLQHIAEAWNIDGVGGQLNAGKGIRIGILDTGISASHPAFSGTNFTAPSGFPQASSSDNLAMTSGKVIVVRSFDAYPAVDTVGHGTAVAQVAAGVPVDYNPDYPYKITGVAPGAYLGVYRVNRWGTTSIPTSIALQALDAAVNDRMDVINMSFGAAGLFGASTDTLAGAARNAADAGVIIVNAAGNEGPDPVTVDDTASDPKIIAVGAAQSNILAPSPAVLLYDIAALEAANSSNSYTADQVNGQMVDISTIDSTGLGCPNSAGSSPYPAGSLTGKVPLILRGTCTFNTKFLLAQAAGAKGAIIYDNVVDETPYVFTVSTGNIPGLMISNADGLLMKQKIASTDVYKTILRFCEFGDPTTITSFSSTGPSVELAIKPDLIATGDEMIMATQSSYSSGEMYGPIGLTQASGTSFSSPLVAGSAAVLKAFRPGLYSEDYRSLLVNTAAPLTDSEGASKPVQSYGAGTLNLVNSLNTTVTAHPSSLSFGSVGTNVGFIWRQPIIRNVGTTSASYTLSVQSTDKFLPTLTVTQLTLSPGEIAGPVLVFQGDNVASGTYQGMVLVKDDNAGTQIQIPYWMDVAGGPAKLTLAYPDIYSDSQGNLVGDLYIRVLDVSNAPIMTSQPTLVSNGTSQVISVESASDVVPGTWVAHVKFGTELYPTFTATAGSATRTFTVSLD